jgi:hypothetical protein
MDNSSYEKLNIPNKDSIEAFKDKSHQDYKKYSNIHNKNIKTRSNSNNYQSYKNLGGYNKGKIIQ